MKLKDLLNKRIKLQEATSNSNTDKLIKQLVDIASSGELSPDQITNLNNDLLSARRKWFAAKKSPDDRKASAQKAKDTRILKKVSDDVEEQLFKTLNIDRGGPAFAISLGRHKDTELQKKFDHEYNILYPKLAAKAGVTDKESIQRNRNFNLDSKA